MAVILVYPENGIVNSASPGYGWATVYALLGVGVSWFAWRIFKGGDGFFGVLFALTALLCFAATCKSLGVLP